METFKTKGRAKNGILSVDIPKKFDEKELEILIINNNSDIKTQSTTIDRTNRLLKIVGTAKYPDFPIDKYDVYEQ